MKIKKRILSLALAGTMTLGLLQGMSMTALAEGDTSTYTIDIPSALTVTKTGWNDQTAGIKASGTLEDGKKLTVTATSPTNNFNLKSGNNSVAYKLAAESEKEKSYSDATATTAWEFSKEELATSGGKTETVGVILEDITNKHAGTAHIRATANDGSGVYGECTVTVSDLSAYYSKMVECGCDDLDGKCATVEDPDHPFTGKVLSADQAIALAQAKAAETGINCAVFYDGGIGTVAFAKNDGTTGSAESESDAADKGLSGYKGYYVSK